MRQIPLPVGLRRSTGHATPVGCLSRPADCKSAPREAPCCGVHARSGRPPADRELQVSEGVADEGFDFGPEELRIVLREVRRRRVAQVCVATDLLELMKKRSELPGVARIRQLADKVGISTPPKWFCGYEPSQLLEVRLEKFLRGNPPLTVSNALVDLRSRVRSASSCSALVRNA